VDTVRTEANFPDPTDVPGLGDVAIRTGQPGHNDLFVVGAATRST
jgi:hypothetical protein